VYIGEKSINQFNCFKSSIISLEWCKWHTSRSFFVACLLCFYFSNVGW